MKKPPPMRGAKPNEVPSLAAGHATGLAFARVDRNQESIPVGVGKLMSWHIGAVIERAIHFEAVVVLCSEIPDVLQYDAFAVSTTLALELHRGHLTAAERRVDEIPGPTNLDRSFLHFQFAPLQTVRLENHGRKSLPLFFVRGWIERDHYPFAFLVCTPLVAKISGQPIFSPCQVGIARVPFAHFDRHIELAVRMLGVFVEIAGTEQMAAAGFHVIRLHLPGRLFRSRGHENQHTQGENAYLLPTSHVNLLL